jgi:hypothetical protein
MPIKPENRTRYPANWSEIRAAILARAADCCEGTASLVVLTIAQRRTRRQLEFPELKP